MKTSHHSPRCVNDLPLSRKSCWLPSICVVVLAFAGTLASVHAAPPTATTLAATGLTSTSATLNASVNPNSLDTFVYFEYGIDDGLGGTTYGSATGSAAIGAGAAPVSVSIPISGLSTSNTYHFRVVAVSSGGLVRGADLTFSPGQAAPVVTTGAATDLTATAATLNGVVTASGLPTSYHFDYGPTLSYGSSTPVQNIPAGSVNLAVSAPVSGLAVNSPYHFRLVATNTINTTNGLDSSLNTTNGVPAATTSPATNITATGSTLNSSVNPNGLTTLVYFEYGLTTAYGSSTAISSIGSSAGNVPVSTSLSSLNANTPYHFRVVAVNSSGITLGADSSFTTPVIKLATLAATATTSTSATLNGTVNPGGQATSIYFQYGPTNAYGSTTPNQNIGSGASRRCGDRAPQRAHHQCRLSFPRRGCECLRHGAGQRLDLPDHSRLAHGDDLGGNRCHIHFRDSERFSESKRLVHSCLLRIWDHDGLWQHHAGQPHRQWDFSGCSPFPSQRFDLQCHLPLPLGRNQCPGNLERCGLCVHRAVQRSRYLGGDKYLLERGNAERVRQSARIPDYGLL